MAQIRRIPGHFRKLSMVIILLLSSCGGPPAATPEPSPTQIPTPIVTPSPANSAPEIVTLAASPKEICPGDQTSLVAVVVDPDGDQLKYVWNSDVGTISNPSEDSTGGEADYLGPALPGDDTIELTVSDGNGGVDKQQASVTVRGDCVPLVRIDSPKDIITCSEAACQFEVKGLTSSVVSRSDFNDLRLYILIFPIDPPGAGWYIQLQPGGIQTSDGLWSQSPSWVGSTAVPVENGHTLKIVAVVVSTDAVVTTVKGTRTIDQMTGSNDDNVVRDPKDISATVFIVSDVVNLTIQK
jgi:hypothetical protein